MVLQWHGFNARYFVFLHKSTFVVKLLQRMLRMVCDSASESAQEDLLSSGYETV